MKKTFFITFLASILFVSSFVGASINTGNLEKIMNYQTCSIEKSYTHTVYVEVYTTQWCGPCSYWNDNIYSIYSSGDYDFVYAEFILQNHDSVVLNADADNLADLYGVSSIPTSVCDGNYQQLVGNYPDNFPAMLDACGNRAVSDITADMIVIWSGDATITINVVIENNEESTYNGYIRAPIVEKISRYDTAYGNDYHNGLLDFAFIDEPISIPAGGTYENSVTWNGNLNQDGNGDDFGDITKDNIKVLLAVLNDNNDYVDEAIVSTVSEYPITILDPIPYYSSSVVNITGRSSGAFISNAFLTIKDITNSKYWDGDSWESSQIWLDAIPLDGDWGDGSEEWYYDTSMIPWFDGNEFMITAKSIDYLDREDIEPPTTIFYYDSLPPDTIITQGPTGLIDYNDVFIEWIGSDEHSSYFVYQYKLGIDSDWSVWLADTSIEYNGLMNGDYIFMVKAKDAVGNVDPTPANISFTIDTGGGPQNNEPFTPQINGPSSGEPGGSYDYTIVTTDPEFDDVFYYIEWGDGDTEEWIGSYSSGEQITINHTWDVEDTYVIRVKAKDLQGAESDWATLEISIPKDKIKNSIPFGLNLAFGSDVDVKIIRLNQLEDYVDLEVLSKPFYIWHNELTSYNTGAFIRLYDAKGLFSPSISFCFGICSDWAIIG